MNNVLMDEVFLAGKYLRIHDDGLSLHLGSHPRNFYESHCAQTSSYHVIVRMQQLSLVYIPHPFIAILSFLL